MYCHAFTGFLFLFCFCSVFVLFDTAKVEQVKFDTTQLHARPELAAEQRMVDDASGEIQVRELLWLAEGAAISLFPSITWFVQLGGG